MVKVRMGYSAESSIWGPEHLWGICIDKEYKFPIYQGLGASLFWLFVYFIGRISQSFSEHSFFSSICIFYILKFNFCATFLEVDNDSYISTDKYFNRVYLSNFSSDIYLLNIQNSFS